MENKSNQKIAVGLLYDAEFLQKRERQNTVK